MNISCCIAAALLATTAAGCSSCAKDDAASPPVPSETPPTALTDRKVAPLPRHFERRNPPSIENFSLPDASAAPAAPAVVDAGSDATTH